MDREKIKNRLISIIVDKLGVDENEVTEEAVFTHDLGADSLDVVELQMEVEKEFSITIPTEDEDKLTTVGILINYIYDNQ